MTSKEKIQYLKDVCGKYWITLRRNDPENFEVARLRLRCNSWLCDICRKKKSRKFALATEQFFKGDRVSILSLTMNRSRDISASYAVIKPNWNRLRTFLTRKIGRFKYVQVLEAQPKSGFPHLHVLINKYIPAAVLKKGISASGFGRIYDIKEVNDQGAFAYVRKYLSKKWSHEIALDIVVDLHMRFCSGSRGFRLSRTAGNKWSMVDFKMDGQRALDYVQAIVKSHMPYFWEVTEYQHFDDFERYRLEYFVERSHVSPGVFKQKIHDEYLHLYYHLDDPDTLW